MAAATRPRRSVLYMPGSNARALDKGRSLPADVLILDLEDAVAPDAKDRAREAVLAALHEGGFGHREVLVRVNGPDTPWGDADLRALAGTPADGLVLPKVDDASVLLNVAKRLDAVEGGQAQALWCMIETPLGVLNAREIAAVRGRLAGLVMGTSDLANDLHAAETADRLGLLFPLAQSLLAARAYGLAIIDGVHLDLEDDKGFAQVCQQAAVMGFDGKSLIHPRQIDTANTAFSPSEDEVARARRIIAAYSEALREDRGVVVVDGRLVEQLHVDKAQRVIALAEAIGMIERVAGVGSAQNRPAKT